MIYPTSLCRAGAAVVMAATLVVGARAEECLPDWGEAGQIVRNQKLLTVQQLIESSAGVLQGQIMKTTLCKDGDDYIYKVVVRRSDGQLRTVVVDAKTPLSGTLEGSMGR
jgi:hypothetical protein